MNLFDLTGRHAVVTGGGTGIGLEIARGLVAHGASVSVWGRRPEPLQAAVAELGDAATHRVVDVTDEAAVVDGMAAEAASGNLRVAVLNAGTGGAQGPFLDSTRQDLEATMATNVTGLFLTMREAGRHLKEAGGGSIVTVASLAAIEGAGHNQAYGASKGAVLAMTNGVAVELARYGVRANTILPGWIATDMTEHGQASQQFTDKVISRVPFRRWGRPEEFAGPAVYLASDASSFQTGSTMVVDGGYSIF